MKYRLKKDLKAGDLIDVNLGEGITEEVKVKVKRFKPENGEKYFCIGDCYGVAGSITWHNDRVDNSRYDSRDCYKTKEEAQAYLDRRNFIYEFRDFADEENGDWEPDWNDNDENKYFVSYNFYDSGWTVSSFYSLRSCGDYYFRTKLSAQKAIDKFGNKLFMLDPMWYPGKYEEVGK